MSVSYKVMCEFDGNKPTEIDDDDWVVKGMLYTPIIVYKNVLEDGTIQGFSFELMEINLDKYPKYGGYNASRFSVKSLDEINYLKSLSEASLILENIDLQQLLSDIFK
jgi:hypothetical protein